MELWDSVVVCEGSMLQFCSLLMPKLTMQDEAGQRPVTVEQRKWQGAGPEGAQRSLPEKSWLQ